MFSHKTLAIRIIVQLTWPAYAGQDIEFEAVLTTNPGQSTFSFPIARARKILLQFVVDWAGNHGSRTAAIVRGFLEVEASTLETSLILDRISHTENDTR